MELLVGVDYAFGDVHVTVAGGPGLNDAIGAPKFRLLIQIGYAVATPRDAEGDGLADADDARGDDLQDIDR